MDAGVNRFRRVRIEITDAEGNTLASHYINTDVAIHALAELTSMPAPRTSLGPPEKERSGEGEARELLSDIVQALKDVAAVKRGHIKDWRAGR